MCLHRTRRNRAHRVHFDHRAPLRRGQPIDRAPDRAAGHGLTKSTASQDQHLDSRCAAACGPARPWSARASRPGARGGRPKWRSRTRHRSPALRTRADIRSTRRPRRTAQRTLARLDGPRASPHRHRTERSAYPTFQRSQPETKRLRDGSIRRRLVLLYRGGESMHAPTPSTLEEVGPSRRGLYRGAVWEWLRRGIEPPSTSATSRTSRWLAGKFVLGHGDRLLAHAGWRGGRSPIRVALSTAKRYPLVRTVSHVQTPLREAVRHKRRGGCRMGTSGPSHGSDDATPVLPDPGFPERDLTQIAYARDS